MIMRSPAQIRQFLDENLWRFDLGTQYLGDEPNVVFKDWDACSVRTLMVASWAYEQAAGNQSIPAVYKAINIAREDFLCDRFYLPATPRDMRLLEKNGIPVFGIEYKHAMTDFDVVSTSISYPVLAMSFVKMLSMSGVPVRWRERGGTDPFVLVGGQAYAAPEVLAPVVDAFYLGEAEDEQGNPGIGRVMERISQYKQEGRWSTDRVGCYEAMAREFPYLYFPRFVEVIYDYQDRSHVGLEKPSKQVVGYRSLLEGMRMPFERHYVRDLDAIPPLDDAPLLYTDAGNASGDIEVARGCPSWCSFCRLSWVTKPYRQRSVDYMVEFGKNLKRNMGGTHVAYVAPDFPMHTEKKRLTKALVENVTDEVDGAAMRIDDFIADDQFVTLSSYAGMDGVTLGLEGNSQRMRDLVGKGVSDAETREAVRRALEAGVRKVKLFMISNMPGEDEGDIERIVQLARDLAEIRDSMGKSNVVIQFSWTPLLIEANTPFQWFAPTPANYHLSHMWDAMRDLKIDFKIGDLDARELVLTPDRQWVPIGELEVGDAVVDPDGETSEVTGVYPQGVNQTYAVRLVDGTEVVASGDHLWDVAWGSGKGRVLRTLSTLQLKERLETKTQAPEVVTSPGLAVQSLGDGDGRLDPYVLGLLLGDGCFRKTCPQFASADQELVDSLEQGLPEGLQFVIDTRRGKLVSGNISQRDGGGENYPRRENPLTGFLRDVGLWGKLAHEKFVPESFKWASAEDRLALLQGLMDTDGGINRGSAMFVSSSEQLRDDVLWLARSLGLVARGSDHAAYYTRSGGERVAGRRSYKARVWWTQDVPVFRLKRKADHPVPKPLLRKVKAIEPLDEVPTVCISVSAQSERFVASSGFVPTHNSKSEVNKVTFFQLCQRASREIGEVLVDTMLELNVACWGGVPKSTRDLLDANMVKHGFLNGLEDAFDERGKDDLFGWEFISTGVSQSLLWDVYQQMVEFLEITDSTTYDEQFEGSEYHGAEWLSRCDERCLGKACGACTREDLEIRKQYTAADDESIDLSTVDAIDERSVAVKVRARLDKSEAYRLVTNDHWRFTLRRALYRAQEATDLPANIVKRSIVFASDAIGFKDWTHGTDYVEFALTKPVSSQALEKFLAAVEEELVSPTGQPWMQVGLWKIHPPTAGSIRADLDLTLYEVEVEEELSTLQARLRWWDEQESVDMTIRAPVTYFGPTMETVNAKEYVDGLWLAREGHRVVVRMLVRGRPSPYNVLAAFLGNPSWLEYARFPARRVDSFVQWETDQWDFFFPACQQCGVTIPVNVLEQSYDPDHCPKCKDSIEGRLIPV